MFSKTRYCPMCDRELPKAAFKVGESIPNVWLPYLGGGLFNMYYTVCIKCLTNKV